MPDQAEKLRELVRESNVQTVKPSIVKTGEYGIVCVPEQLGQITDDAIDCGATRLTLAEILSRFSQSKPVYDLRLIGEIEFPAMAKIKVEGRIGGIEVELYTYPDGAERYRLRKQDGWIYGIFGTKQFSEICVIIDGVSVPLDLEVLL